ncbi:hypothetical protein JF540_27015 [Salipiger thiooxidans]|uniref:hypothetical protein n=1 Tax=Salipiger thiooxidans TaxID=282683 RepID=UPI001A8FE841|nr:hypothetical protein [Salipiger thiooxidans]MBN8190314.1 hypothetical protein [Salipiger thiooxidans]
MSRVKILSPRGYLGVVLAAVQLAAGLFLPFLVLEEMANQRDLQQRLDAACGEPAFNGVFKAPSKRGED